MPWSWKRAAVVVAVVLVAHFLPPERSAPAPDDMSTVLLLRTRGVQQVLNDVLDVQRRPLGNALFAVRAAWTWDEPGRAVTLLALSAALAALACYALFRELLRNDDLALVAALVYALLPNKVELFHTGLYAGGHVMQALHTGAALLFLRSLRLGSRPALAASACAYLAANLMSEGGILLPLAVAAWAAAQRLPRLAWTGWFAVPAAAFGLWYLAAASQAPVMGGARTIQWERIPQNVFSAPSFFVGRNMARAAAYGLVQLGQVEPAWLAAAIVLDAALLGLAWRWLSRRTLPWVPAAMLWASLVALIAFLVPNALYLIEDRHTPLSDLGFAILLLPLVAGALRRHVLIPIVTLALLLLSAQGNAWNHVVACRINRAVDETIRERRPEVVLARRVIFDLASFTARIPYAMTPGAREHDPLATYYGAQVFAPWGLTALVRLAGGSGSVIASVQPLARGEHGWQYVAWQKGATPETAPEQGTLVIDYSSVYGCGYERGNRLPCGTSGAPGR